MPERTTRWTTCDNDETDDDEPENPIDFGRMGYTVATRAEPAHVAVGSTWDDWLRHTELWARPCRTRGGGTGTWAHGTEARGAAGPWALAETRGWPL
jgi:hypothetical protein